MVWVPRACHATGQVRLRQTRQSDGIDTKSVGTEDGGEIDYDDVDGDRLLGVETHGAGPQGLCGFDKTMARG